MGFGDSWLLNAKPEPAPDDSKIRAETASGIKDVIQGRNGVQWADACLENPHITLPPGAGYLMARAWRKAMHELVDLAVTRK